MMRVATIAPAKLNLALAVGPPQSCVNPITNTLSTLHPICSWMHTIKFADSLTLTKLEPDRFSRYAIFWADDAPHKTDINWPITKDLAVKAHLLLESATGKKMPVQLKLEKKIPVGAGLGGGSSDAAAMLIACNNLFKLQLTTNHLVKLARKLGSDIPFFVHQHHAAIVEGFGEQITPINPLMDQHLILCLPDSSCNTAEVYHAFDTLIAPDDAASSDTHTQNLHEQFETLKLQIHSVANADKPIITHPCNDLQAAAYQVRPSLKSLAYKIETVADKPVHLTGSGAAMFILADNAMEADLLANALTTHLAIPCIPTMTTQPATTDKHS